MVESRDIQTVIDDLDFVVIYLPDELDEKPQVRRSVKLATEILTWLPDDVIARIPNHFRLSNGEGA